MNVYHLKDSTEPEGQWVKLQAAQGLKTLIRHDEEAAFFAAHPRLAAERSVACSPQGSQAQLADLTRFATFNLPVFSARAKVIFEPHLDGLGQWVALDFDEAPYWLFFLTAARAGLDVEASDIWYVGEDRRISRIARPCFQASALQNPFMWTPQEGPGSLVCVGDAALDLVRQHRLTGFCFELLWSRQHGPLPLGLKAWEKPRFTGLETDPFDADAFWARHNQRAPAAGGRVVGGTDRQPS
jgi:hypothetical protein